MKKLMIAAAAAAMVGGAFAGDFAGLYNLKFTLKTLAPKTISCSKSDCNICKTVDAVDRNYYENGTVKLEGIIAYCSVCSNLFENYATGALALWDPSNKEPVYFSDAWKVNPLTGKATETVEELFINAALYGDPVEVDKVFKMIDTTVYGKSSTKVAMDFVMDYDDDVRTIYTNLVDKALATWDLRAAGLGTYCWMQDDAIAKLTGKSNKLLGYVKSVSGNVAGRIPAKTGYTGTKGAGSYMGGFIVANECAGAADYCADISNSEIPLCEGNYSVPAYGTWSMKRNDSATKKALYKSIPSYL